MYIYIIFPVFIPTVPLSYIAIYSYLLASKTLNFAFSTVRKMYDYVFAENGLVAFKSGELVGKQVGMQ